MNYAISRIAAFAALLMIAAPASAATYSYDFTTLNSGQTTYSSGLAVESDGLTVEVTAGRYDSYMGLDNDQIADTDCADGGCQWYDNSVGELLGYRAVAITSDGLGIAGFFDGSDIDGDFGNDLITFTFDRVVDFTRVFFTGVESFGYAQDQFDVFVDGVLLREEVLIGENNPYDLTGFSAIGRSISFGADSGYDNFRIGGLEVELAAVPLPAGGLLLLSGLFGLALARRRGTAA
ncbi:VPLPA-CTERM sorting domain-containing protein [Yoonia sediminilitoris]|uniref:Putative secreted protein n=1 Tax=Yoonia sediminilitoris TaxID=1286148 RepID=A0A2T6K844_9RHOB|nr:VPLPA-CTERM sorting domain-containing protein [Yoonia sediminilitoris]PUB10896.1 putative secreted protein [Yoonia sediminilitoris]RCW90571.1 putative secreted protein [Yoonia sediminilitoris]